MNRKDKSLLWLISGFFWVFLVVTVAFVIYVVFIPTPTEWGIVAGELKKNDAGMYIAVPNATSFPSNFNSTYLIGAVVRHLSVFPEHISSSFLISTLNFAFLTMFIRNIGKTVKDQLEKPEGMVKMPVYVEWAMGSLISGILFFSSNIDILDLSSASIRIAIIVVFALVSYYVLYELRKKLRAEEGEDKKKDPLLRMKDQDGKLNHGRLDITISIALL